MKAFFLYAFLGKEEVYMSEIIVKGTHADAKIFTASRNEADVEKYAFAQIKMICDDPSSDGSAIRLMPDVHPGKIGPVGLTMTVGKSIIPGLIGIDIGCGLTITGIDRIRNEFDRLDSVIRQNVPAGMRIRDKISRVTNEFDFDRLICRNHIRKKKAMLSLGTLGGGNHFIEIDRDEDKNTYLTIHTGSRHLGKEVAEHYMNEGQKALKDAGISVPYELTYLTGELCEAYLHDVDIVKEYAELNRQTIIKEICREMKWKVTESFSCIHNYVDLSGDAPVLRKGAISAKAGEKVIIPINMKEGVLLGTGIGNPDWNMSAPHGSGRIASREEIKKTHTVSEFRSVMKGIYSTCIGPGTLDEAPFAYRNMDYIKEAVKETVRIEKVIRPVYNFKGGDV